MALVNKRVFQELILLLTALFALCWAILRASVQSLTIDEADSYLSFASGPLKLAWYPSSNNHVLNSVLMWMTTHLFGPSSVALRAPALLGALLYIAVCYFLCRVANQFSLRLLLFICLLYNPFILDFMVAARGYGLGSALLLAAIAVPVWHTVTGTPSLRASCILTSLALGLSFTANFSFACAGVAAFLAILIWAIRRREAESTVRLAAYCALPGLLVALLMCGYALANWRSDDSFGLSARSLAHMFQSIAEDSLYQLDPRFASTVWYKAATVVKPWLLPLLAILCLCQLIVTRIDGSWLQDAHTRRMGRFAAALTGIAALSVLILWLAFRFYGLPLPLERRALYLVPLLTLVVGIVVSVHARSVTGRWLGRGLTAVFLCLACYFVLCLRLNYFKEWQWDADVKDVYPVLAKYNHTYGITDVGTSWYYVAALNYYRLTSKKETFQNFSPTYPYPPEGKPIYVLHGGLDRDFLEKEKLKVVYHGKSTDVVIAVNPEVAPFAVNRPAER